MRQTLTCSFCQNKFDAPSSLCPHCGGPVPDAGIDSARWTESVYAAANDDALAFDVSDEAELILVPVTDPSFSPPPKPQPKPPPLPWKRRFARA